MKKVLIVTHDMQIGGAQKSLLSFLTCLDASAYSAEYEIHLLLFHPTGQFLEKIPRSVKVLPVPRVLYWMGAHFSLELITHYFSLRGLIGECWWLLTKTLARRQQSRPQRLWQCWKHLIPKQKNTYDIAVSYIDGPPNYYVIDKVNAKRKNLWVHSEYQKQGYKAAFDYPYFKAADAVVTISSQCRNCLLAEFPQLEKKLHVLENITNPKEIISKSKQGSCPEFSEYDGLKLLSVGRLHPQKGIDLAIGAARRLKETGVSFRWLIVGEGTERDRLMTQIKEAGIEDSFFLIGARSNPYVYMAQCDILIQPSRVEGKSIVLDEVKLLQKPIVVTNYATVAASVTHGENGWITDMTAEGISDGIVHVSQNPALMEHMRERQKQEHWGNEEELSQYISVMFE